MNEQQTPHFNYQTLWSRIEREAQRYAASPPVSYTHLTLPTTESV